MKENEKDPWKVISRKDVYETPWIKVTHHDVITPGGSNGIYGTVHFKNYAIGILPLDENNYTWLVGQYRFPVKQYSWEIPEGGGPVGEDPLDSAKRELLEETGIAANEWTMILQLQLSNSATDEVAYIYLARGLSFSRPHPEETEELQQKRISFNDLYEKTASGEITDSLTVAAVLKVKLMMLEGLIKQH